MTNTGLTEEKFIQYFRDVHGWECLPGTRIHNCLSDFAEKRQGSHRDIDELYVIFCMSVGLQPYPEKEVKPAGDAA